MGAASACRRARPTGGTHGVQPPRRSIWVLAYHGCSCPLPTRPHRSPGFAGRLCAWRARFRRPQGCRGEVTGPPATRIADRSRCRGTSRFQSGTRYSVRGTSTAPPPLRRVLHANPSVGFLLFPGPNRSGTGQRSVRQSIRATSLQVSGARSTEYGRRRWQISSSRRTSARACARSRSRRRPSSRTCSGGA